MNDVPPGLPSPARHQRPVPTGGAHAAAEVGRARRQRALATGGGSVMSALAVLLAVSLVGAGGGGQDSLGPVAPTVNEPTPTTPGRVEPPGATTPSPKVSSSAEVSSRPCGKTHCTGPEPSTSASASATSQPEPAAPTATRPSYTETPREFLDPATCLSVDAGAPAEDPAFCTHSDPEEVTVVRGDLVSVEYQICATSDTPQPVVLSFPSGAEHEGIVRREGQDAVLWRFSQTVRFTGTSHERRLDNRECLGYQLAWRTIGENGAPLPAGRYLLDLSSAAADYNGRAMRDLSVSRTVVTLS